jgi:hypothetical protein
MKRTFSLVAAFVFLLLSIMNANAQPAALLSTRQQALVTIASYTAKGDLPRLHDAARPSTSGASRTGKR